MKSLYHGYSSQIAKWDGGRNWIIKNQDKSEKSVEISSASWVEVDSVRGQCVMVDRINTTDKAYMEVVSAISRRIGKYPLDRPLSQPQRSLQKPSTLL